MRPGGNLLEIRPPTQTMVMKICEGQTRVRQPAIWKLRRRRLRLQPLGAVPAWDQISAHTRGLCLFCRRCGREHPGRGRWLHHRHWRPDTPRKPAAGGAANQYCAWYSSTDAVKFASYSVCKNDPARTKPVNPLNPAFIINANAPQHCPVYLTDNKPVQQTYTFTVTKPPPFTIFTLSQVMNGDARWSNGPTGNTTSVIDCSGNQTNPPFQQSSKAWRWS